MHIPLKNVAGATLLAAVILAAPLDLSGQEEGGPWESEAELGAAIFFGNTSQTTITTRLVTARADSAREIGLGGQFAYGEATDDDGDDFVVKRSWKVVASYDHRPFERLSPFLFAESGSSYERRIEFRYSFGVGAKYMIHRSETSQLDLSAAILGEETNPSDDEPLAEDFDDSLRARWSLRSRARRSWDDGRLTFSSENFYRPEFDDFDVYTFETSTSLAFRLMESLSLKLTFLDNYDSEARSRGARSNNDGQVLMSLLASF